MVENVIWPVYLDADRTRSGGRRVPLDLAVSDPSVEEIAAAVEQIGYDADVDFDASHPQEFGSRGCVVVHDVDDTKNDLIQAIAAYLGAMRE